MDGTIALWLTLLACSTVAFVSACGPLLCNYYQTLMLRLVDIGSRRSERSMTVDYLSRERQVAVRMAYSETALEVGQAESVALHCTVVPPPALQTPIRLRLRKTRPATRDVAIQRSKPL